VAVFFILSRNWQVRNIQEDTRRSPVAKKKGSQQDQSGGVTVGDVSGGIHGSIIAGRDVVGSTASYDASVKAAEEPTVEKLQELLDQIQKALAELNAQQELLEQIDPAAPVQAQLAEKQVNTAAGSAQAPDEVKPEDAESMKERLEQASGLLNGILDAAKSAADKAVEVGKAVKPIAEALEPVVVNLAVAVAWVAKLWPPG
jgi:hypothetical protein